IAFRFIPPMMVHPPGCRQPRAVDPIATCSYPSGRRLSASHGPHPPPEASMKTRIALALVSAILCTSPVAPAPPAPPQMTAEQKAMMDKMAKAATPGPQHAMLAKMAGDWAATVKYQMDPSQPWQESQSTSTVTALMDGRYTQEVVSGQMMGAPFS